MLGTLIESALSSIGLTSERVEKWLGRPCGCKERREKLDSLTRWAARVIMGRSEGAKQYLDSLTQ